MYRVASIPCGMIFTVINGELQVGIRVRNFNTFSISRALGYIGVLSISEDLLVHFQKRWFCGRLRIGYCRLTHEFPLKEESPPICDRCELSTKHMLDECQRHALQRRLSGLKGSMKQLLQSN
ncbi:uncharacterized protein LOC143191066 isoform X2 [Rhynchophorus ferrugineus]|uniref:uncharacterized protein LOC143191066 isoform X2 n=1 Tax=Rhynchophorus ferrugineus TaxID=354439 RepID=UPI003FCE6BDF